jgi:hypothetical protein
VVIENKNELGNFAGEIEPFGEGANIAVIEINPDRDLTVIKLKEHIGMLRTYAVQRVIAKDEDIVPATDDLSLIANLKKAVKEKQDKYCGPVKQHLDAMQAVFKDILAMLEDANGINRLKITSYRAEQVRKQKEIDEINRQAMELARKQAELSGTGEYTVDTTPIESPAVINKVQATAGGLSFAGIWTWELEDIKLVPDEYKILDRPAITRRVKSGERNIPGVRIFKQDSIRVNAR